MSDRRVRIGAALSPLYLPYFNALCAELPSEWQPFQGLRTFSEQEALYAKGRTELGEIVTWAKPGDSPHNYGCATDWTLWNPQGKPIWTQDVKLWVPYFNACEKVGLKKGADFGDKPHNELSIAVSWRKVHEVLVEKGSDAAQKYIETVRTQ